MKFWIKKEYDAEPNNVWQSSYIMTINRESASTIYSNLPTAWYRMGKLLLDSIYEDLFIIGLTVFALDKRISRRLFVDCWTREIEVSIPVLNYDKWVFVTDSWNRLLSFLTGDKWDISFRPTEAIHSFHENPSRRKINIENCDCVSLFSGGLDSYCGAIKLFEDGKSPILVGHNEYPKLRYIQERFCENFRKCYPEQNTTFVGFTAGARAPINREGVSLKDTENTSRGRSLLFLCSAVTIAGIMGESTPVYIPENGFIGLNVALSKSRKGSCSTRTTHPYFIKGFSNILEAVGIKNTINNFFAFNTKREIVNMVKGTEAFRLGYKDTISCSHPCVSRYNRSGSREYPVNCGYCYPCLIRKGSLQDVEENALFYNGLTPAEYLNLNVENDKSSDLFAVLGSIYRYNHATPSEIRRLIKRTGTLSLEEINHFERVYSEGMKDLNLLFDADPSMAGYIR